MPFVAAPNIIQVQVRASFDSQLVENRFHVNVGHEPTDEDLASLGNQVATIAETNWAPQMPDAVTLTEIFLKSLHTQNAPELTKPFVSPVAGGLAAAALPNNNTLCVSLRSAVGGRSARGRLYWIGLTEADVTANAVSSTRAAAIVEAVDAMRLQITLNGWVWTIVSYFTNGAPREGGPVYFDMITPLVVDLTVDSQRRRLPGRGR